MLTPSSPSARLLAALLTLGAAVLCYRARFLIWAGYAALYVGWLRAMTWAELALAVTILGTALAWLVTGAANWCKWTLRLTVAIILLHSVRVAVFALARIGPWFDFDLRPSERPLDPESWSWFDVWFAVGMSLASLVVLAAGLAWWRRTRAIHK